MFVENAKKFNTYVKDIANNAGILQTSLDKNDSSLLDHTKTIFEYAEQCIMEMEHQCEGKPENIRDIRRKKQELNELRKRFNSIVKTFKRDSLFQNVNMEKLTYEELNELRMATLDDVNKSALEAQDISVNVYTDLLGQKTQLQGIDSSVDDIGINITQSSSLARKIKLDNQTYRALLFTSILLEVIAIVLAVTFKIKKRL